MLASLLAPVKRLSMKAALAVALAGSVTLTTPMTQPAGAQSMFAAALYVNDEAITNYEITQKMRFLEFVGASNVTRELAIERLIEDRLQAQEVARLGGRLTPDQVQAGMTEFAGRANLTTEELLGRMQGAGIDRETFESFIRAGVMWRELVRSRYGSQISISDAQIEQALSVEGVQPSTEVLISEIFLPADPQFAEQVQRIIPQIQRIRSETEFSNAARQVSAAPSGPAGGRVDRWINVQAMPPAISEAMASAPIGTVLGPLDMPGAYAFFQLRARRDSRQVPAEAVELTYRRALLPGGRSETNLAYLQQIRAGVDQCSDFPALVLRSVPGLPDSAVEEITERQTAMAAGLRTELERLNPGEISANMVDNGNLVLLMLCTRSVSGETAPSRENVRMGLMNRALEGQAALYLDRLRAEAEIRYP